MFPKRIPFFCLLILFFVTTNIAAKPTFRSHPPQRPLPIPSKRPIATRPAFFVDDRNGNDKNNGSKAKPWKTINHAVSQLRPGATLYLRGGTYYENVQCRAVGREDAPITIRSFPGELAILDGGMREFFETPEKAWEPVLGRPGEFRSTEKYPGLRRALGNFGDSMIPLHSYKSIDDLRAKNEFSVRAGGKAQPMYLGPGLWYDERTQRIHIRLAHTHVKAYGPGNYRGETDPRKLPLVITGFKHTPWHLEKARHVRIFDIVIRGGGDNTVLIRGCDHIEFDGCTIFVGNRGMRVETTGHLRVTNTAFRGPMPPWGSRTASKYRTVDSHLFVPVGTLDVHIGKRKYFVPQCHDFELAHCEFTDGHDGPYVGGVHRLKFHHNLVDNMNDDGIYVSAWGPPGSGLHIYQNYLSRCLTTIAFGLGRGSESEPSKGVYIYRNVFDLRGPVPYQHPGPDNPPAITTFGRIAGDHGGPVWDPMFVYHNTFVMGSPQLRGYPFGWGGHLRKTSRRVFNNIFVQTDSLPGVQPPKADVDFQTDGNLIWSLRDGPGVKGDYFAAFRKSPLFKASKKQYAPGWEAASRFGDPRLFRLNANWKQRVDVRLRKGSPAINAGVALPKHWPDSLRKLDNGRPDIGALPFGAARFMPGVD